jgi:hypothetical protein
VHTSRVSSGAPDYEGETPNTEPRTCAPGNRNPERGTRNAEPSVGFKEWALICDSMLRGETSLIFRKGGIAEGREGFRFRFERFYLFPTYFHEQIDRLRLDALRELLPQTDPVIITGFAEVEFTSWIDDLRTIEPLEPLHVMKRAVLQERFSYDKPEGVHLAFVRVHKLGEPWEFPFQRSYRGCRSWVDLPTPPIALDLEPVLSEDEHARRRDLVRRVLEIANSK